MPIFAGALGTIRKNLEKNLVELKIRGRIKFIEITKLFKSARILCRVLAI